MKGRKLLEGSVRALQSILDENAQLRERMELIRHRSIRPHARLSSGRECPRIEFECASDNNWHGHETIYWMVLPIGEYDIRAERSHDDEDQTKYGEWYIPVGQTKTTGGNGDPPHWQGKVHLPFRDGAHSSMDRDALGLPNLPIYGTIPSLGIESRHDDDFRKK